MERVVLRYRLYKETAMKEKLEWTDTYSIHNEKIDRQHQYLFDLYNKMQQLETTEDDVDQIKKAVVSLYDYVKIHFKAEEDYMASIHYPGLDDHHALHEEIVHKMNEYMKHSTNIAALVYKFKVLLYDWAMEHILQQDQKICRFTQRKEKAQTEEDAETSGT